MKNVAVHLTPTGEMYDEKTENVVKIWVENSLDLGWNKEDIILVNNFPYSYKGINSTVIPQWVFCTFRPGSSKTCATAYLLNNGTFSGNDLWWVHDPDAFQLNEITEEEIRTALGVADVGFTTYGWSPKWSMGSYFFKESANDIFRNIKDTIYEIVNEDERALVKLIDTETIDKSRVQTMNITYNVGKRHVDYNYNIAEKPIKVLHFRPYDKRNLHYFIRGENDLEFDLIPERLLRIFHSHGIR